MSFPAAFVSLFSLMDPPRARLPCQSSCTSRFHIASFGLVPITFTPFPQIQAFQLQAIAAVVPSCERHSLDRADASRGESGSHVQGASDRLYPSCPRELSKGPRTDWLCSTCQILDPSSIIMSSQSRTTSLVPTMRVASPGPLSSDFTRQQVAKQQRNNYHSSSLRTMNVNQTSLHPHGVT